MFENFRESVKRILGEKKLTYSQLGQITNLATSTIKSFMCGANDSRRVAEKIANALSVNLVFQNGKYLIYTETNVHSAAGHDHRQGACQRTENSIGGE